MGIESKIQKEAPLDESSAQATYKEERWPVVASFIAAIIALMPLSYPILMLSWAGVIAIVYPISKWVLGITQPQYGIVLMGTMLVSIPFAYLVGKRIFLVCRWKTVVFDGRYCRHCRYDLTGNESGVCPECGTPIVVSSS